MGFADYIVDQMLGVFAIAFQIIVAVVRGIIEWLAHKDEDEWNVEDQEVSSELG